MKTSSQSLREILETATDDEPVHYTNDGGGPAWVRPLSYRAHLRAISAEMMHSVMDSNVFLQEVQRVFELD